MVSSKAIACLGGALWAVAACSAGGGPAAERAAPVAMSSGGAGTGASSPSVPANGGGEPLGGNGLAADVGAGAGVQALDGTGTSAKVPCNVAAIIEQHCATCHGATPAFSAPMSLVSAEDFGATAPLSGPQKVREVAARRINASGAGRMPPAGTVEALDAAELTTLTEWLSGGAPAAIDGCPIGAPVAGGGANGELLPRPAVPGTVLGPYQGWDENVECYPFTAYQPGGGNKDTPYRVGTAVDQYIGFGFRPPWQGTRYVRAFRSVIDNEQVLHHWILFQEPSAADNSASEILGAHPGGQMLHGWAPGGSDLYFTPDVGVRMDSSTSYLLEVHYNSRDANATDASGLEICVTATAPENEAIISWLGTDAISGTSATGTCRPRSSEPIHIIAGTPHMHLKGAHMKVVVERASGTSDVVHDEPFSFENQRGYPQDIVINQGDSIATTCTFNAPATFGKGTNEEMCYWFALAYPAGALADGGFIGTLTHGANSCLGR